MSLIEYAPKVLRQSDLYKELTRKRRGPIYAMEASAPDVGHQVAYNVDLFYTSLIVDAKN